MTIKENTQAIRHQMDLLKEVKTVDEAKIIFIELEALEKDRVILMSEDGKKWHEAYSAGMGNACKLMVDTLSRLENGQ